MKFNELNLINNKSIGQKDTGDKQKHGFSDFIINTMTQEKFKEDNKKLIKLPTSIYAGNQEFNKKVQNLEPTKKE